MAPRTPGLFSDPAPAPSASAPATITAHCDGGARGNPGPSGYGAEITDAQGNVIAELSEFLGIRTNNFAEYSGLLASLQYAIDNGHTALRVISDSELMVKQIQGLYKVKSPDLIPLWQEAKRRIGKIGRFEIAHALRHKNKAADRLANQAMDRGMKRGTAAEGRPLVQHPDARLTQQSGVQSLPLRAIPYPAAEAPAPPAPIRMDPAQLATQAAPSQPAIPEPTRPRRETHAPIVLTSEPARAVPIPRAAANAPRTPEPGTMLRGFTRNGAVHLLGSETLPDGIFVKIIPE